ncbi:hypothetical protein [Streptomyces sp. 7N604]|uniref:hypothetical protein n=1 Tax=Streptomyces sp. 7N604 TaxID=3457415 RepID=UPI003FD61A5A
MSDPMIVAVVLVVAAAVPRVVLFWLMARERERIFSLALYAERTDVVMEHSGPERARLAMRAGRGARGVERGGCGDDRVGQN